MTNNKKVRVPSKAKKRVIECEGGPFPRVSIHVWGDSPPPPMIPVSSLRGHYTLHGGVYVWKDDTA